MITLEAAGPLCVIYLFCLNLRHLGNHLPHPLQRPVRVVSVNLPVPGNSEEVSLLQTACLPPPQITEKWFAEFSWPTWSMSPLLALLLRMAVNVNLKAYASLLDPGVMSSASLSWVTKQLSVMFIAFLLHILYFMTDHCGPYRTNNMNKILNYCENKEWDVGMRAESF